MVIKPCLETFKSLLKLSKLVDSYDGGDQGLLNVHFRSWYNSDDQHRLPFAFK
jgi:glycogenin glucosyltransferase